MNINFYIITHLSYPILKMRTSRNSRKILGRKKIEDVYNISNALTIEKDWNYASKNVIEHAIEKGWFKDNIALENQNRKKYIKHCFTSKKKGGDTW